MLFGSTLSILNKNDHKLEAQEPSHNIACKVFALENRSYFTAFLVQDEEDWVIFFYIILLYSHLITRTNLT